MIASSRLAGPRVAARRIPDDVRRPLPSRGLVTSHARLGAWQPQHFQHSPILRAGRERQRRFSGKTREPSVYERMKELLALPSASAVQEWLSEWAASSGPANLARTAGLALAGLLGARIAYNQLSGSNDWVPRRRRRDASKVTVLMPTLPMERPGSVSTTTESLTKDDLLEAATRTDDGRDLREIDEVEFASFVQAQRELWAERTREQKEVSAVLFQRELEEALSEARSDRVRKFADWYFAYPTTYQLMGIAISSATKHALTFSRYQQAADRVVADLQDHIGRKYEALVLRPAITDARIHRAFVKTLQKSHEDYCAALQELEGTIADYVMEKSEPYTSAVPQPRDVAMDLDWPTQLQKVDHVHLTYEKKPELLSAALIGGGAALGKLAGGTAMTGAAKAMAGKLAAPFATKAVGSTLGGKAASAAAAGALFGGPAGAAMGAATGAAIGVGVDMTVNAGVALMQRSAFEQDIRDSLDATRMEWEDRLLPELERVQSIWYDHALSVMTLRKPPETDPTSNSALVAETSTTNTNPNEPPESATASATIIAAAEMPPSSSDDETLPEPDD